MLFHNLTLDPFQEEAIAAIEQNQSVVVSAPTGSGKTLIADFIISKHYNSGKRIIYTAPIKALSNQKYHDFCKEYGDETVGLMTGDVVINPMAKVVIMTTEIYRNMAVSKDADLSNVAYVIFDEIHFINDIERGYVWEESIIYSSKDIRFLCLSATIPNAEEFSDWISAIKEHTVKTVITTKRNVPLQTSFYDYDLGMVSLDELKAGIEAEQKRFYGGKNAGKVARKARRGQWGSDKKAMEPNHVELISSLGPEKMPCLFFSFSRKDCQMKARELARKNLFKKDAQIVEYFLKKLSEAPPEINKLPSTAIMREVISQGIAFHHAGLLPVIKETVEELFAQGKIKVLYATETFAVGINMPAKTVCFNSLRKYDGFNFRNLNTKEYFQIAGRAGRRGIDTVGYVVSMIHRPTFKYEEVMAITSKDIEPINSQFKLSVNTVLNLIDLHTPQEIEHILRLSFYSYQKFGKNFMRVPTKMLLARYESIVRKLRKLGYVDDSGLTDKGHFSAKVFADEISMGEVFATGLAEEMDEYQILLVLAALVYEPRERRRLEKVVRNEQLKKLTGMLLKNEALAKERKFLSLPEITSLISPVYNGKSFFAVLEDTDFLEGDLIRFYMQVLDRIGQVKKASVSYHLITKMDNCRGIIEKALEGIYLV
ncbi:DEAD/DEAH box helicase [Candidatus Woesearchaeota archaeon]|nr:DEAD/DEAH box helicase [Candidatus Woesearchaeota archaeon]